MSGAHNVSTDRGLSIQPWYGVAAGAAIWALFMASTDQEALLGGQVYDAITLLGLLAWPLIPVSMYLDLRRIGGRIAWNPATKSWLLVASVPVANVPAGAAYCLRRNYAVRGVLPSSNWRYGVYAGVLAWVGLLAADVAVDHVPFGPLEPVVFGPVLFLVWLSFPVVVYLDAVRFSHYPDRTPRLRALVVLSAIPLVNVLAGAVYAGARWWARRKLDPDVSLAVSASASGGDVQHERISPWYRRAVGVYVVYFLAVVALGSWLSLGPDLEWNVLGLVVWPAFGVVFTVCFHLDNRAVREAGVEWGRSRYAYYLSVVVPAAAFWYLLSRYTKVSRARSNGRLDGDVVGSGRVSPRDDAGGGDSGSGDEVGSGDEDRGGDAGSGGDEGSDGEGSDGEGSDDDAAGGDVGSGDDTGFEWGGGSRD